MPICSECNAGSEVRANFCGYCGARFPASSVEDRIAAAMERQNAADQSHRWLPVVGGCVGLCVWIGGCLTIGAMMFGVGTAGWLTIPGALVCGAVVLWNLPPLLRDVAFKMDYTGRIPPPGAGNDE